MQGWSHESEIREYLALQSRDKRLGRAPAGARLGPGPGKKLGWGKVRADKVWE